jgi:uncharacterized membrane protein YkgB
MFKLYYKSLQQLDRSPLPLVQLGIRFVISTYTIYHFLKSRADCIMDRFISKEQLDLFLKIP